MKKKQFRIEGVTIRGWECPSCQETVLHPEDAQQLLVFHKLRKGFPVRIGALGESLIIRFPKEVVQFYHIQKGNALTIMAEDKQTLALRVKG